MSQLVINAESPAPLRLAALFWMLLDKTPRHKDKLEAWAPRLEALRQASELDFDEFRRWLKFVTTENDWTAENLRVARDPMGSLEKQAHTCFRVYAAYKAGLRARERKGWRYGACPECDERPAPAKNAMCDTCVMVLEKEEEVEFWQKLQNYKLIDEGNTEEGEAVWYVGKTAPKALVWDADLKELRRKCWNQRTTRSRLEDLIEEIESGKTEKRGFEIEELD